MELRHGMFQSEREVHDIWDIASFCLSKKDFADYLKKKQFYIDKNDITKMEDIHVSVDQKSFQE